MVNRNPALAKRLGTQRPPIVGYENGDTRVLDFASRRKAKHMAQTLSDDVVFWEIWRLYAGMREV